MKRRARWSHLTIALAVIAAAAIATPAIGGQSATTAVSVSKKKLKNLIKKEVAKQIGKATGPAGTNGVNGTDGTARAYARVAPHVPGNTCTGGLSGTECTVTHSKGVSRVTRVGQGRFCVSAPGIDSDTTSAAVTADESGTGVPSGNASAMINSATTACPGDAFEVSTHHQPVTGVRNATDNGTAFVAGNAASADTVAFTIVIP